jgi:ADP-ribose pyrophosphatase YjhB (NUDIX family)
VDAALEEYLRGLVPVARERVVWPFAAFEADVASYLTDRAPPTALVSSVRAVVRRGDAVLVFDDERGVTHALPGGRREIGEPIRDALLRELAEETGCRVVGEPRLLGALHFHVLRSRTREERYPHPDLLQAVFAVVTRDDPVEPADDPWVRAPRFIALSDARRSTLGACERVFLRLE